MYLYYASSFVYNNRQRTIASCIYTFMISRLHVTEQVSVAVTLVLGKCSVQISSGTPVILIFFVVLLSHCWQILRDNLD
jgi:hypothetical protein